MSVILKDTDDSTIYTFPSGVELTEEPWSKRLDIEPRAHAHGGVLISDEKVATRVIFLHGIFDKSSQALMESELNSMKKACYTEDLRLYATQNSDDFYKVECFNFEHIFLGMLTVVEINVDFQCADPFRYYKNPETTDTKNPVVSGTPYALTNDNDGDIEVYPTITFTAGGTITNVKIENVGDAGKYFEYAGTMAITKALVVDCKEGTVEYDGSDDIANFTGSFFKLISGTNTITITVTGDLGTSTCTFVFRKKYL
ncbi:hypothetical protein ES703_125586 [subsurface metagenome]